MGQVLSWVLWMVHIQKKRFFHQLCDSVSSRWYWCRWSFLYKWCWVEACTRENVSKLVRSCKANCPVSILLTDRFVVNSPGEYSFYDKKAKTTTTKFGARYIHYQDKCLKNFDTANFYAPHENFRYEQMTIDPASKVMLEPDEVTFLAELGIKWRVTSQNCHVLLSSAASYWIPVWDNLLICWPLPSHGDSFNLWVDFSWILPPKTMVSDPVRTALYYCLKIQMIVQSKESKH